MGGIRVPWVAQAPELASGMGSRAFWRWILTADLAKSLEFYFSYLDQPALSMALAWTPIFLQL